MKTFSLKKIFLKAVLILLSSQTVAQTHEWRGPDRSGEYSDEDLLQQWP